MFSPVNKKSIQTLPAAKPNSDLRRHWNHYRSAIFAGICLPVLILVSACDSDSGNTMSGQLSNGELSLSLPGRIRDAQAVNPNAVIATATVNNLDYPLTRTDNGRFQTSITIDANQSITASVSFSESLTNGAVIELASHPSITRQIGSGNATIEFFDSNYQTDFDRDADGCDNLSEREVETNPLVNDAVPVGFTRTVAFTLPAIIPDPELTRAVITVAETPRAVVRVGTRFQSSGAVSLCSNASINVLLLQQIDGRTLVLASASVAHGTTANIELSDGNFNFNEDADGDGRINVTELRNNTDPFVAD